MLKSEVFRLSDLSRSFATRMKGEEIGGLVSKGIENLSPDSTMIIDWNGVVAVSPSFVDELVKVLAPRQGAIAFSGMSPSLSGLVERVSHRRSFPVRYVAALSCDET